MKTKMSRDLNQSEYQQLERLVDVTSVASVLMALSTICGEKADHIRVNWQDNVLARQWDTAAGVVGCAVPDVARAIGD